MLDEGSTESMTTERLRMDALTMEHIELLVALDADAEVMRYINGGQPTSRTEVAATIRASLGHRWAAFTRSGGEFVAGSECARRVPLSTTRHEEPDLPVQPLAWAHSASGSDAGIPATPANVCPPIHPRADARCYVARGPSHPSASIRAHRVLCCLGPPPGPHTLRITPQRVHPLLRQGNMRRSSAHTVSGMGRDVGQSDLAAGPLCRCRRGQHRVRGAGRWADRCRAGSWFDGKPVRRRRGSRRSREFTAWMSAFSRLVTIDRRGSGSSDPLLLGQAPPAGTAGDRHSRRHGCGWVQARQLFLPPPMAVRRRFCLPQRIPDRVRALVLRNSWARLFRSEDYPIGRPVEDLPELAKQLHDQWGDLDNPWGYHAVGADRRDEPGFREVFARLQQLSASKAAATAAMLNMDVDVRDLLPLVQAPTLVLHGAADSR